MRLDIEKQSVLDKDILREFCAEFGIETSGGTELLLYKSDCLRVKSDGRSLSVGYYEKAEIFRGLLHAKRLCGKPFDIKEKRKFEVLGIMIDCSRNAVLSPRQVEKALRYCAAMGYNELQLYTEDTYEISSEPLFGYMRGRYIEDELKRMDNYAAALGIELVPCVQTLAHNTNIRRWARFDRIIDEHDILLAGEEETYEFIDKIFASAAACFTSRKINIGMDEAHLLGCGKYFKKHGYRDKFEIMSEHLKKVLSIAEKYGFKSMMWSDMFFRIASGGDGYYSESEINHDMICKVPKDVELVYWDYVHDKKEEYDIMIRKHKRFPNRLRFAGGVWTWMGFSPHLSLSIERTKAAMESTFANGVNEFTMTLWGLDELSGMSALPALFFAAETAYGRSEKDDEYKSAFYNLTDMNYDDFMKLELPNVLDGNPTNPIAPTPSKYLLYNDCFMGLFDSTVAENTSKVYASHANELQKFANNSKWGCIFGSEAALCRALALKADLGIRTRKYYTAGNKDALKELAAKDYSDVVRRIEKFDEKFGKRWLEECKPQGLEVYQTRNGGLIHRIKRCRERLLEYCDGKICGIPELDEKTLDFNTGKEEFAKKPVQYNFWLFNPTASRL